MLLDARLGVGAVGADRHLPAGVADGLHALGLQRDRQQADRDLLAGRRDHVELALQRARDARRRQFLGQPEQAVGLAAHCRRDDDHLVAGAGPFGDPLGDIADALGRPHRGAAVLVNDECHGAGRGQDRLHRNGRRHAGKASDSSERRRGLVLAASDVRRRGRPPVAAAPGRGRSATACPRVDAEAGDEDQLAAAVEQRPARATRPAHRQPGTASSGCVADAAVRPGTARHRCAGAVRSAPAGRAECRRVTTGSTRNVACQPGSG